MHIDPAYFDAQILNQAIEKTAKIVQDMNKAAKLIEETPGFTQEQRNTALDCVMQANEALDKLINLRLSVM